MKKLLVLLSLALLPLASSAQDVKTFIPERAKLLLPTLKIEVEHIMPDAEFPWYFGALIEHESCLSLKHSRCWSPTSQLLTSKEQGLGLGQLTRTWNPDGSIRFDTLADMRREYRTELKDLSWDTLKDHPELQMRTMILMVRKDLKFFADAPEPMEQYRFADSSYNGGRNSVRKARTKCSLTNGCNPDVWDDNVELHLDKSRKPLYGTRSPYDINTHHVHDVTHTRMPKYKPYFK